MKENETPTLKIPTMELSSHDYNDGFSIYSVTKLFEESKKYKEFDLPLIGIDTSRTPWKLESFYEFVKHAKRCSIADLRFPVILDTEGYIADGWHRVAKAMIIGRKTIRAIRLEEMPHPDRPAPAK